MPGFVKTADIILLLVCATVTSVLQFISSGGGHMEKSIFHHFENPPQIAKSIASHNKIEVYGAH